MSVRKRSWVGLTVLVRVRVGKDLIVMENGLAPMCTVAMHSLNLSLVFAHEETPLKDAFGTGGVCGREDSGDDDKHQVCGVSRLRACGKKMMQVWNLAFLAQVQRARDCLEWVLNHLLFLIAVPKFQIKAGS